MVVGRLQGSAPARRVDHRTDGDRHEPEMTPDNLVVPKHTSLQAGCREGCGRCRPSAHRPRAKGVLLKRALFAWLIADGDMHLKNMALLKTAEPGDKTFRSVRLVPLYDPVTTRVFPRLKRDRMALKLNGKDERLRRGDFRALASIAGMRAADADAAIDDVIQRLRGAAHAVALPKLPGYGPQGEAMVARMLDVCQARTKSFD